MISPIYLIPCKETLESVVNISSDGVRKNLYSKQSAEVKNDQSQSLIIRGLWDIYTLLKKKDNKKIPWCLYQDGSN